MSATTAKDVSLGDLGQLPFRANIALAMRAVLRVTPLFRLDPDDAATAAHQEIWDQCLALTTDYLQARAVQPERLAQVAQAAYRMADAVDLATQYSGYAAAHAVQACAHAAQAGPGEGKGWRMQVVGATFGALRVLFKNADAATDDLYKATVWSDLEKVRQMTLAAGFAPEHALDASEAGPLGPLWPFGVPANFGVPRFGMGFPV